MKSFVDEMKRLFPPAVRNFALNHEYDTATDRTQAVYGCSLEDLNIIHYDAKKWIESAIGWADYVIHFGDYDTKEEFFHGTDEEWAFEVKKSSEWISLLQEWRDSL